MLVKDVLKAKGRRIVSVPVFRTVGQILSLLAENNISSVVVSGSNGKPKGIVTDRLLIRVLARRGADGLALTAADVMESPAPACEADDSIQEALWLMTDRRVRHLIVEEGGEAAGLVSIGDLVKYRLRDSELEGRVLRDMAYARLAEG